MDTYDGIHTIYEGDVQYPYADVGAPELLHISKVTPENRRTYSYVCPCCQKRLRPRLGKKNRHCFFHDKGSRCSMDKYIHETAKRLLKEKFDSDEPFELEMPVTSQCRNIEKCRFKAGNFSHSCKSVERKTFNLKDYYQECLVEKQIGDFRPDLALIDNTGKRDPIFIEIWHKHKSDDTKLTSGNKIIEIRLKKMEDLEMLVKEPIRESDTVQLFNFKPITYNPDEEHCLKLYKFVLYPSFKSFLTPVPTIRCIDYLDKHFSHPLIEITANLIGCYDTNEFWQYCLHICRDKGFDVKDCYMCKHSRRNREAEEGDTKTVYCKKLTTPEAKHICEHTYGKECDSFETIDGRFLQLKQRFFNSDLYIWMPEKPDNNKG